MGGHDPGFRKGGQQADQFLAGTGIQVAGGFIQNDDLRVHGKDRSQRGLPLFAHTHVVRRTLLKAFQPHFFEGLGHSSGDLLGRDLAIQRSEGYILKQGGAKKLVVRILKNHSHLLSHPGQALLVDDFPQNPDRAVGAGDEPVQMQQQRGFAGPVGTDQPQAFPPFHRQVQSLEGLMAIRVGEGKMAVFLWRSSKEELGKGGHRQK